MKIKYRVFHIFLGLMLLAGLGLTPGVSAQGGDPIENGLALAVELAMVDYLGKPPVTELVISNVVKVEQWAFGVVNITAANTEDSTPEGFLFLAKQTNQQWQAAIDPTPLFKEWIPQTPDQLVSAKAKAILGSTISILGDGSAQFSLPWATGETWTLTGGPHSSNGSGPWNSLDFAGGSKQVRALSDGVAYPSCNGVQLVIKYQNGWEGVFYHLSDIQVGWQANVTRGQYIGVAAGANDDTQGGCGGSSTGPHVHLSVKLNGQNQAVNGLDIGGWTVEAGSQEYSGCLVKNGVRKCKGASADIYNNGDIGSGDTTPPTTTATPSGTAGETGWYRSDVTVTFSATDNSGGTGVNHIEYRVDGGSWQSGSAVTLSTAGSHTLGYRAQDNAGNWESEKQLPVNIDKTAPTGSVVINNNASVSYASLVYLNSTASDALSGVSQMRFRDSGGTWSSWQPFSAAALWQLPVASGQTAMVEAQFQDRAGNPSATYSDTIPLNLYPARPASSGYTLTRSTLGVSSGQASSTGYKLGGTWGQPSAVSGMSSAGYRAQWGYWQASIPQPQAAFTGSPTIGVAPLTVNFGNSSSNHTASLWNFGDGQTSAVAAPSHAYTSTGVYTVSLKVAGPGGTNTLTRTNYITVSAPVASPVPAFTGSPTSGTAPLAVSFTNTSTGTFTSSLWAFGDGLTSTEASPAHSYATAGSYTVSLKVTGPGGSNALTRTNYITVSAPVASPVAAFTGSPTSGTAPLTVNFTNTSSNYTSSLWAFWDGQSSTIASPAHTYTSAGVYTVSLKVTGPGGSNALTRTNYITVSAPPTNGPVLSIPANIPASVGQPVQVPVQFTPNGATIASTVFSIDYDHTCLTFDPTDSDSDGVPNAVSFNLPAAFAGGVVFDSADTAGELDFTIIDSLPPLSSLPGQTVATITFTPKAACQPAAGTTRAVAVNFAAQPASSFGSTGGGSVPGSTVNGSVSLSSVRPGDGNCDNQVDAGDLSALVLEIFDGDGNLPGDVPGGSFPGCPGADANQDNKVDAGDLTCTVLRIFGGSCGGAATLEIQPLAGPGLTLPSQIAARPGETVTVPVQYAGNGNAISSLVFSLDIDPTWLTFDPTDANADDLPDAVQVSLPAGFDVSVIYDPTDTDGEVDISILDPLAPLATLPDGQLMSLTFTAGATDTATETALIFSVDPPLSFGSTGGASVTGSGTPGSVLIESQQKVYLPVIIK